MYLQFVSKSETDMSDVRVRRYGDGILCAGNEHAWVLMDTAAARELVRQLEAVLDEPKPEPLPDPRGYVFIDADGDAWGWDSDQLCPRAPGSFARRPFFTRTEAQNVGNRCAFGCVRVEVWTPESRVPPMPEDAP